MRPKTSIIWKIESEVLKNAVKTNDSFSGVLRCCGIVINVSMYKTLKRRLKEENIDYSNIKAGINCNKGRMFPNVKRSLPLEQVMVKNSTYCRKNLKKSLLKNGVLVNECSICGLKGEWNGKKLIMILDHINGVNNDHRLENLRMVCGNCNSQLDTHSGKNKKILKNVYYCGCGEEILKNSVFCDKCARLERRKAERPNKEKLKVMVAEMPMTKIGEKYGVSDNTIRKWCKSYGI